MIPPADLLTDSPIVLPRLLPVLPPVLPPLLLPSRRTTGHKSEEVRSPSGQGD